MRRLSVLVLSLTLGLAAAGCGGSTDSLPLDPSTPPLTPETFSGTLRRESGATHTFLTAASGPINAVLTTVSPDSALVVGLSLGTWNGNVCQVVLAKDNAVQTSSILGSGNGPGTFCVRIYDVGNVTDPIAYQIDVTHP